MNPIELITDLSNDEIKEVNEIVEFIDSVSDSYSNVKSEFKPLVIPFISTDIMVRKNWNFLYTILLYREYIYSGEIQSMIDSKRITGYPYIFGYHYRNNADIVFGKIINNWRCIRKSIEEDQIRSSTY